MALKDLLKPKSPADLRRDITAKLLEAQVHLTHSRNRYGKAETDVMEGLADSSVAAKAEADLAKAKREVDRLKASLDSLDERARLSGVSAHKETMIEKWVKVENLSAARTKKAAHFARLAEDFSAAYLALALATDGLNNAIREVQQNPEVDGLLLWSTHIETAARKDLFRRGLDWAFQWPWGKPSLPEFMPQFEDAEKMIQNQAGSALDKLRD